MEYFPSLKTNVHFTCTAVLKWLSRLGEPVVPHGTARVGTNTWLPSPLLNNIDQRIFQMEIKERAVLKIALEYI